jgi:hypothetical protein
LGPQCKLDGSRRDGAQVTWSMTCTNAQNAVHSDGVARYSGDTMEATLISHLPNAKGAATDLTQYITGRYLGACTRLAEGPQTPIIPPRRENAAASSAPGSPPRWLEPPPTTAATTPSTGSSGAPAAPPAPTHSAAPTAEAPAAAAPQPSVAMAPPEQSAQPTAESSAAGAGAERGGERHWRHPRRYYAYYRRWRGAAWSGGGYGYGHRFGPSPYSAGGY